MADLSPDLSRDRVAPPARVVPPLDNAHRAERRVIDDETDREPLRAVFDVPGGLVSRRAVVDLIRMVGQATALAAAATISGRVAPSLGALGGNLQRAPRPPQREDAMNAAAASDDDDLDARELMVEGAGARHRMMLFTPRHVPANPAQEGARVPLLVLLHGLGETTDETLGAHAWSDRYGLVTTYERLRRPPIARTSPRADWTDARLAEVNASLAVRPFRGFVIACPFMPRLASGAIDAYARWLVDAAIPRARAEASSLVADPRETIVGGCSLGGYVSLEIFLRHTGLFRAWCGVQSAISEASAPSYAARLARAIGQSGPRDLHLETSTGDPFRAANVALAASLEARGIPRDLRVLPGPHDQPWLREAGTLEALLWCDRLSPRT